MRVRELGITNIGTVDLKLRLSFGGTDEIRGIGAALYLISKSHGSIPQSIGIRMKSQMGSPYCPPKI